MGQTNTIVISYVPFKQTENVSPHPTVWSKVVGISPSLIKTPINVTDYILSAT